ncbi:MAG TPA: putative glycolipid-binding domain-containing protein [Streptosporangiaceae bacterium]|nr:putative glycolipid-binding domain-containing protein [Streptosporangiaceae bacterium]
MAFRPFPAAACWRHRDARVGFEVAYFRAWEPGEGQAPGWRIDGTTTAIEDGRTWVVSYRIEADAAWATRRARITATTVTGSRATELRADGAGHWLIEGQPAPHLDGCLDVDLESSAMTNTLPVHRLDLGPGTRADAPAAYVRAATLAADRLEQVYRREPGQAGRLGYDYAAPAFGFTARLVYDEAGLIVSYPGIAERAG